MPFEKGTSGNPGGRPRRDSEAAELSRAASPRLIQRLIEIAEGEHIGHAIKAANCVLDRGLGRAPQGLGLDDDEQVLPPAGEAMVEDLLQLSQEQRDEFRAMVDRFFKRS